MTRPQVTGLHLILGALFLLTSLLSLVGAEVAAEQQQLMERVVAVLVDIEHLPEHPGEVHLLNPRSLCHLLQITPSLLVLAGQGFQEPQTVLVEVILFFRQ